MGQDPLFSLFVRFSTDISEFMKEYFRGFELALHSPWDRALKGSSAEEIKTAASGAHQQRSQFPMTHLAFLWHSLPNVDSYI